MILNTLESISQGLLKVILLEFELKIREFGLEKLNLLRVVLNVTQVSSHALCCSLD